jgi:hypothetical protein
MEKYVRFMMDQPTNYRKMYTTDIPTKVGSGAYSEAGLIL